jgi:hypothetical protein
MNSRYLISLGLVAVLAVSCTKPYTPKAITTASNYLVVEGVINLGPNAITTIMLSRTVGLASASALNPELGATIAIQDNNNQSYNLQEMGNGVYNSPALTLNSAGQYRLSIHTADGKDFLSDYQTVKITPPIDSIGFTVKNNGMQVYVNTHDPNNNTHYYRWDYAETWEFDARYYSSYVSNNTSIVNRSPTQYVYQCWSSGISTDIILGSSAKLSQDVISQSPIVFIPSTSEKIELRYSILLKEYALTADAYNYFEQLKTNTEQLGSIFDAQPTQLTGNIHCTTDAALPVIGYITAGTVQQKRVYIDKQQLPSAWVTTYPYDCNVDSAYYSHPKSGNNDVLEFLVPSDSGEIPLSAFYNPGNTSPAGFLYTDRDCGDCSVRGTLVKPAFWQ